MGERGERRRLDKGRAITLLIIWRPCALWGILSSYSYSYIWALPSIPLIHSSLVALPLVEGFTDMLHTLTVHRAE